MTQQQQAMSAMNAMGGAMGGMGGMQPQGMGGMGGMAGAMHGASGMMAGAGGGGHHMAPAHVELELELQLRGNLLVQQQRRIVQLEDELQKTWQQLEMMKQKLDTQQRSTAKTTKKVQSRYWAPEEHERFLEALEK